MLRRLSHDLREYNWYDTQDGRLFPNHIQKQLIAGCVIFSTSSSLRRTCNRSRCTTFLPAFASRPASGGISFRSLF